MARLSLSLLGSFAAVRDGQPLLRFATDKVRALLAYLAVESDRAHRRQSLAGLLWPDCAEETARTNLRGALADLRQALGAELADSLLLVTRDTMQLNLGSDLALDVAAFRALIESADATPEQLQEALNLRRGRFLEGFALKDSPGFEDWLVTTRERLENLAYQGLQRLIARHEAAGELTQAVEAARRLLRLAPWQEEAHRQAMRLLALSGTARGIGAVRSLPAGAAGRADVEPDAETTRLYERIRDGEIGPRAETQSRLPASLLPLIGRERELAELTQRLREPGCRLVSLVGLGGSGKTRLALEAARRLEGEFARGAHLVPLSAVESVDGLVPAIAQGVGFRLLQPASGAEAAVARLFARQGVAAGIG